MLCHAYLLEVPTPLAWTRTLAAAAKQQKTIQAQEPPAIQASFVKLVKHGSVVF